MIFVSVHEGTLSLIMLIGSETSKNTLLFFEKPIKTYLKFAKQSVNLQLFYSFRLLRLKVSDFV